MVHCCVTCHGAFVKTYGALPLSRCQTRCITSSNALVISSLLHAELVMNSPYFGIYPDQVVLACVPWENFEHVQKFGRHRVPARRALMMFLMHRVDHVLFVLCTRSPRRAKFGTSVVRGIHDVHDQYEVNTRSIRG